MRAIVVREAGDPSVLRLEELPAPSPGPGEVTIDVAFAGTGFVDTLFRSGALPAPVPFVPGIDPVGGELRAAAFGHLAPFGRQIILGNATGAGRGGPR